MATETAGDDLRSLSGRSLSQRSLSRKSSSGFGSRRSWGSASIREAWNNQGDVFQRSVREDDEEELKWAAIERLPTYDRLKKGLLKQVLDDGRIAYEEVDVQHLDLHDKKSLMESILRIVEEDNENFLKRLRERTDRSGFSLSLLFFTLSIHCWNCLFMPNEK